MESCLDDGGGVPAVVRFAKRVWCDREFVAKPESSADVIDLHGDYCVGVRAAFNTPLYACVCSLRRGAFTARRGSGFRYSEVALA